MPAQGSVATCPASFLPFFHKENHPGGRLDSEAVACCRTRPHLNKTCRVDSPSAFILNAQTVPEGGGSAFRLKIAAIDTRQSDPETEAAKGERRQIEMRIQHEDRAKASGPKGDKPIKSPEKTTPFLRPGCGRAVAGSAAAQGSVRGRILFPRAAGKEGLCGGDVVMPPGSAAQCHGLADALPSRGSRPGHRVQAGD